MPGPTATPNESRGTAEPVAAAPRTETPTSDSTAGKSSGDAPEISRSVGVSGGAVVLWPRIVLPRNATGPDDEIAELAGAVQAQLAAATKSVVPPGKVDIRPAPERVCPRSGCQGISVGALLARANNGCAVMALISRPGASPAQIVPWVGRIRLDQDHADFREPPEKFVHVDDYVPCDQVPATMARQRDGVEAAVRKAL